MTRDGSLGQALRELPVPDPAPDFFDRLTTRLEEQAMGTASTGVATTRRLPRWFPAAAAAAVAMAAGVGVGMTVQGGQSTVPVSDELTYQELQHVVLRETEVPEAVVVDPKAEAPYSRGSGVLGGQLLSATNLQKLEEQVTVLGGARSEYRLANGTGGVSSLGAMFESEADASLALGFIVGVLPAQSDPATGAGSGAGVGDGLVEGPLMEIAAEDLGDEAYGFEGFMDSRFPGTSQTLYLWRDGRAVLAIWGTGFSTDEVRDLADTMASRLD